jgi:hypothetical protein
MSNVLVGLQRKSLAPQRALEAFAIEVPSALLAGPDGCCGLLAFG